MVVNSGYWTTRRCQPSEANSVSSPYTDAQWQIGKNPLQTWKRISISEKWLLSTVNWVLASIWGALRPWKGWELWGSVYHINDAENCNVGACGAREIARLLQVRQLSLCNINHIYEPITDSRMTVQNTSHGWSAIYFALVITPSRTTGSTRSLRWFPLKNSISVLYSLTKGYNSFDSLGFNHITFMFNLKVIAVERCQTYTNMIKKRMMWVRFNEFTTSLVMEVGEDD